MKPPILQTLISASTKKKSLQHLSDPDNKVRIPPKFTNTYIPLLYNQAHIYSKNHHRSGIPIDIRWTHLPNRADPDYPPNPAPHLPYLITSSNPWDNGTIAFYGIKTHVFPYRNEQHKFTNNKTGHIFDETIVGHILSISSGLPASSSVIRWVNWSSSSTRSRSSIIAGKSWNTRNSKLLIIAQSNLC